MNDVRSWALVLAVCLVCCGGCKTSMPISYVSPNDTVALVEIMSSAKQKNQSASLLWLRYINGKSPVRSRGNNGSTYAYELTPGHHVFDLRRLGPMRKGDKTFLLNQPLLIELEARAGHNYRINAHIYDADTVSLYIEDIGTGEIVSGHRPEKADQ